jgi:single-stranded-DNA-specific exonuclease
LERLRATRRLGLTTMMEIAELSSSHLTEEHIGFVLGPRLNALGRLGDANPIVEFLTTTDATRARVIATQLEGLNVQRKLLCDQVSQAAETQLKENPSLLEQPVIVLAHPSWPGGVVGIAASRIVEKYGKPAILLTTPPDGPARGSARSIEGLNITAAIAAQQDILVGFGGHPMAAGLSLNPEKLTEFRRRLSRTVEGMISSSKIEESTLQIDGWMDLKDVNVELSEQLEKLAPFGPGNEKLVLAVRGITIKEIYKIGKNKEHLKITVEDKQGCLQEVLWWDGGSEEIPNGRIDLAFTLRASDWRGVRRAQLEWVDFRIRDEDLIEIRKTRPEIIDYRTTDVPISHLKLLPKDTLVWAEGPDEKRVGGMNRVNIHTTELLAIWTIPPSPEVLHEILELTKPKKIYLFAINPNMDEPNGLLERITGLAKYAINHQGGLTSYNELASACAQGDLVIRRGLDWLVKRGQIQVEDLADGQVRIIPCKNCLPDKESEIIFLEIQLLLKETSAYRSNFARADQESFLP